MEVSSNDEIMQVVNEYLPVNMKETEIPLPKMPIKEILEIHKYINRNTNMLEIGGGRSTIYFSRYVKKLVTVEYDIRWAERIKYLLSVLPQCADFVLHFVPPDFPQNHPYCPSKPGQFDTFVEFIDTLKPEQFNFILNDGRDRYRVTLKAIDLLVSGGIIAVHDFWNRLDRYGKILDIKELELVNSKQYYVDKNLTVAFFKKR